MINVEVKARVKDHYPKEKKCNLLTASGSIYSLNYNTFFLPIMPGDLMYAKCNFKDNNQASKELVLIAPPLVQLGIDEPCVKQEIKYGCGKYFSDQRTSQLYDKLIDVSGGKDKVSGYLDQMAESYYNTKSKGLITYLSPMCNEMQGQALLQYWYKKRVLRQLYLFGLNNTEINNLREQFTTAEIYKKCVENPYLLTDIKIEKCDEILGRQNKAIGEEDKIVAILAREIDRVCKQRAYVSIPTWLIMKMWKDFPVFLDKLKANYGIAVDMESVYPKINYEAEINVAQRIVELLKYDKYDFGEVKFYDKKTSDDQKEAIKLALNSWISIIFGDAGAGKSTCIREIVKNLEERKMSYRCTSFTGKATAKIKEVLKLSSPNTMDRMITRGDEEFEWLIIDEIGMVGINLLHRFFKKFSHRFHIVLLGDLKQLQNLNSGNLYLQLTISNIIPMGALTINHRIKLEDGKENKILTNALGMHNVDDGEYFNFQTSPEFQLYHNDTVEPIMGILKMLKSMGVEGKNIQILTCYNKHLPLLNKTFQDVYKDSDKFCIDSSGRILYLNDRVVHNVNDYDNSIMNGDTGIIVYVSPEKIKVYFESYNYTTEFSCSINTENMEYKEPDVSRLDVGFSFSVEKSQGSQYPYVIFYCPTDPINKSFLDRNRLYTTITRTQTAFFCVGNINEVLQGARKEPKYRHDKLAVRMRRLMGLSDVVEIVEDFDGYD
jgi:hypothetical protein